MKQYSINALSQSIESYLKQNDYQNKYKYFIIIIKLIDCDKKRGEFSISHIKIDQELPYTNISHYYIDCDRVILIRTDGLFSEFMRVNGIEKADTIISREVFDNLAGPYVNITGQPSPVMVVKYKNDHIDTKNYCGICQYELKYSIFNDDR